MTLLDSLLDAIIRLEGDALVMHVGERPYVLTTSSSSGSFRGPLSWGQVELSSRALTAEAVMTMVGQMLPPEQLQLLEEMGAVEHEIGAPGESAQRFIVVAARGGDDVWVEVRKKPEPVPVAAEPEPVAAEPGPVAEAATEAPVAAEAVAEAEWTAMPDMAPAVAEGAVAQPEPVSLVEEAAVPPAGVEAMPAAAQVEETPAANETLAPAVMDGGAFEGTAGLEVALELDEAEAEPADWFTLDLGTENRTDVPAMASAEAQGEQLRGEAAAAAEASVEEAASAVAAEDAIAAANDAANAMAVQEASSAAAAEEAASALVAEEAAAAALAVEVANAVAAQEAVHAANEAQAELDARRAALAEAEARAAEAAAALAAREALLAEREAVLMAEVDARAAAREAALAAEEAAARAAEEEAAAARAAKQETSEAEAVLEARRAALADAEVRAGEAAAVLAAREQALAEREASLAAETEARLAAREEALAAEAAAALAAREEALAAEAAAALAARQEALAAEAAAALAAKEAALAAREQALAAQAAQDLAAREEALAAQAARDLSAREEALAAQAARDLAVREEALAAQAARDLAAREEALAAQAAREVAAREEALAAEAARALAAKKKTLEAEAAVALAAQQEALAARAAAYLAAQQQALAAPPALPALPAEAADAHAAKEGEAADAHAAKEGEAADAHAAKEDEAADAHGLPAEAADVHAAKEGPYQEPLRGGRGVMRLQPKDQPSVHASSEGVVPVLQDALERGASTVYAVAGARPMLRIEGEIAAAVNAPLLGSADIDRFAFEFAPRDEVAAAPTEWMCSVPGVGRVRCVSFEDESGRGLVFHLAANITSADELGLSREVQALCREADGLVVIAGPRGSGKSSLLGAFVDLINRTRADHIITIESRVRTLHERRHALISQREVDGDGEAVARAVRAALREGPDVLVVDDVRSPEAIAVAIDAARAGRLVFASIPAPNSTVAIQRLIDAFAVDRRPQIRALLAGALRAVISQVLVQAIAGGRVGAREVLLSSQAVEKLILDGATAQVPIAIESGRRLGMRTQTDALVALVRDGVVTAAEAGRHAPDRGTLLAALQHEGIDVSELERRA